MINFFSEHFGTWAIVYVVNILLIIAIIFNERKAPSATLAWIMVLAFIPILGFAFYLIFNQNLSRSKVNRLTEDEERAMSSALKRQAEEMDNGTFPFRSPKAVNWKHLIKLNQMYGNAFYTQNNDISLITDGHQMFRSLVADIRSAKDFINLETYILKRDYVGKGIINELTKKAREGVKVRLLVDALGGRYITRKVLADFISAGGNVAFYLRPKFIFVGIKFNYRNHRKIAVIDNKTAYTGGYNIGKEYIGNKKKFGYWRDTHLRIEGDAVTDLNSRFVLDWRFASHEELETTTASRDTDAAGDKGVQIVSCGPEDPKEEVKRAFMRMITYAQKNVFVQTPYFIPDPSILESLKMAAQSGVDVRIMIPCMPDHIFVYWATYSYVGELLRSGARVFIYDNGFLHAKTLVVDGQVSTVGSANFDNRSFRLNFETNAFIFDDSFAGTMEETFKKDMLSGHELTLKEYNARGRLIKFKEAISRLMSDIL